MNKSNISFYPMLWFINNKNVWEYPAATVVNLPYPLIYTYDAMDYPLPPPPFYIMQDEESNTEKIITVKYATYVVAK